MRYPVNYIGISQGFHTGKSLDFGWSSVNGGKNQPVFSCDDGVIYKIERQPRGGNVIFILHDNGWVSCYSHLEDGSIVVKVGDRVKLGSKLALMGGTGVVSGNHLHFGLFENKNVIYKDSTINPFDYLFVYPDQLVGDGTLRKYGNVIKYYNEDIKDVMYVYNTGYEGLNVRYGPSVKTPIVELIEIGTKVNVYEYEGNFARIGDNRWVSKNYLTKNEVKTKRVLESAKPYLNVRSGPSVKNKIIATIPPGWRVVVYELKNGWARINHKKDEWVSANYLE